MDALEKFHESHNPSQPEPPVTVIQIPRTITMHRVLEQELDTIATPSNSIHIGFFGVSAGTAVTTAITLVTVNITAPKTWAGFVGLLFTSTLAALYFLIRAISDYRASQRKLRDIKAGRQFSGASTSDH